ncbi:MAG TPA: hypothetical protein VFP80_17375 [Thermoanaerobaculia bacterium]|nr:hypothetical protein [Thermoanaerobaculia bacterium]
MKPRGLLDVVVLAGLSGVLVALWLLSAQDGWAYYSTPLSIRGYAAAHRVLRPSGTVGHLLGVGGTLLLFATLAYLARRRVKGLARAGPVARWLEIHIFCGVFGPILVAFHTSFKFNGVVSVAFWSMVLVVVSGFVGRYLYVRIPKTIRGEELSRDELEKRAAEVKGLLDATMLAPRLRAAIEEEEQRLLSRAASKRTLFARMRDAVSARRRAASLRRQIRAAVLNRQLLHDALELAQERALLLRRLARLESTRRLFQLWHVFHRPLVWLMFFVLLVHLGVAVYFGYVPFGG